MKAEGEGGAGAGKAEPRLWKVNFFDEDPLRTEADGGIAATLALVPPTEALVTGPSPCGELPEPKQNQKAWD